MSQALSTGPRPISFVDVPELLGREASGGRVDSVVNGDVTLSAIPDGAGGTKWAAKTKAGAAVPVFGLTIKSLGQQPDTITAHVPVVIDATEGVYVCYEDEARQQSWCVKVK